MKTRIERHDGEAVSGSSNRTSADDSRAAGTSFEDMRSETLKQHRYNDIANTGSRMRQHHVTVGALQRKSVERSEPPNRTGMPDQLKAGIESLSGLSMDEVKVHYNSSRPAELNAHAFAHGNDIHLGPGQDRHLPHEAWHVVQQAQGRVRPTIQLKEWGGVNSDVSLEAEADLMGAKALSLTTQGVSQDTLQATISGNQGWTPVASRVRASISETSERFAAQMPVLQRMVRYGEPYSFVTSSSGADLDQLLTQIDKDLHPLLLVLIGDEHLHGFDSIAEINIELRALHKVKNVLKIVMARTFRRHSAMTIPLHMKLANWLIEELSELAVTVERSDLHQQLEACRARLIGLVEPESTALELDKAYELLESAQIAMFRLNAEGTHDMKDAAQNISTRTYGYHLTKLHNIPGIRQRGLDPALGASKRGSVNASTVDQAKGSTETSRNKVAFGLGPEIFRPYIHQFLDRRQMIEHTPALLKPVMLRFALSQEVKASSMSLIERGIVDFMDAKASNSEVPILPEDIEVMSADGWIPITAFKIDSKLVDLRLDKDDERNAGPWKGFGTVFTYDEMVAAGINVFGTRPSVDPVTDREYLISMRDIFQATNAKHSFIFRGATMQTSGNRNTWEYAFSCGPTNSKAPLPTWLEKRKLAYAERYGDVAQELIASANEKPPVVPEKASNSKGKRDKVKVKSSAIETDIAVSSESESILNGFERGSASGVGMNCLLDTVSQLSRNSRVSDDAHIATMRNILRGLNLANANDMIDIYGGAGMQIANDLDIRIQVYEKIGSGIRRHPVMGISVRLVSILHEAHHFTPLWPS